MFNASYAAEDVEIGKGVEFSENREKDTLKEVMSVRLIAASKFQQSTNV